MAIVSLLGGLLVLVAGAIVPSVELEHSLTVAGRSLDWRYGGIALVPALGGAWALGRAMRLVRRIPARAAVGLAAALAASLAAAAGFWYGYLKGGQLLAFEYREEVQAALLFLGAALFAAGARSLDGIALVSGGLGYLQKLGPLRAVSLAAVLLAVACAATAKLLLGGMPHISDGLTYLLQARVLATGRLAMDVPLYPELFGMRTGGTTFLAEGLSFLVTESGYFGKYPIGWPAMLSPFDALGIPWAAAPLAGGAILVLVYRIVARSGGQQLGVLTAMLTGASPWLWFQAMSYMSHVASLFWLLLFFDQFSCLRERRSLWHAAGAGLALGGAVLTRTQDALFFALPCILLGLWVAVFRFRQWAVPMSVVAVTASVGVTALFQVNAHLMGAAAESTYGSSIADQASGSLGAHYIAWLHENWVMVSAQLYQGALPGALGLSIGVIFGADLWRAHRLFLACGASLFLLYGNFIFAGRSWTGARWMLPVLPAFALLTACGLAAALRAGAGQPSAREGGLARLGRYYLRFAVVGLAATWIIAVPAHLYYLHKTPPLGVDTRVADAVSDLGLTHAVVALPLHSWEKFGAWHYKDPRSGLWLLKVPFEQSEVIFVRGIEGWEWRAAAAWPSRQRYAFNELPGDFRVTPATTRLPSLPAGVRAAPARCSRLLRRGL